MTQRFALQVFAVGVFLAMTSVARAQSHEPLAVLSGMSVGQSFSFHVEDLPKPYALPSVGFNPPATARPSGALPQVPKGFRVEAFASDLNGPREMAVGADGTVYVSETREGKVLALRDSDGDGKADMSVTFVDGFRDPSGLAVHDGALYVVDRRAVWRVPFGSDPMQALPRILVTRPGALGIGGGHITREITFDPDGHHFYVAIGSQSNVGEDPWPCATIQQFRLDGHVQLTYASGLRSPVGMAFYPGTSDLYAVVNERFGMGGGLVPDYFTRVLPNGFYGFPYAYLGPHPDPQFGDLRPDLVKTSLVPDVLLAPHSGPFGLLFVTGDGLPPAWEGDGLVALHGTRADGGAAGFAVVRIPFENQRPTGSYEAVMTGFGHAHGSPGIWGRPAWLARADDGSLLVSDEVANVIWRMKWEGAHVAQEAPVTAAAGPLHNVLPKAQGGGLTPALSFAPDH